VGIVYAAWDAAPGQVRLPLGVRRSGRRRVGWSRAASSEIGGVVVIDLRDEAAARRATHDALAADEFSTARPDARHPQGPWFRGNPAQCYSAGSTLPSVV
jgi:hypothetical protein